MRKSLMLGGVVTLLCAASAEGKEAYPAMAPVAQYQSADEAAFARTAAPASISADAGLMTLGSRGYEVAAKGKNGFVCLVQRSWGAGLDDEEFWNPKIRSPICFNPAAVRTVLPGYLERTEWVLAGVPKPEMIARTKARIAAKSYVLPETGAMAYMCSKQHYLNDADGHGGPHLMFFTANTAAAAWGANLSGSPIFAAEDSVEPVTTFFIPVGKWSDGTRVAAH